MRLFDGLFRPKYIGRYLADKKWKVILYFVFFLALCSIPAVSDLTNTRDITYSDSTVLFQEIYNDEVKNIKIENNKLNTTESVIYSGNNITVAFNTQEVKSSLTLVFYEDYCSVFSSNVGTKSISTIYYEKLNDSSLDLSLIQNKEFSEIYKLLDYINNAYDSYLEIAIPEACATNVLSILIEFGVLLFILIYAGFYFNPYLPTRIRVNLAVYSLSWAFVLYFVGILLNMTALFYVGAIISFIFMRIASKSIIRVKKEQ